MANYKGFLEDLEYGEWESALDEQIHLLKMNLVHPPHDVEILDGILLAVFLKGATRYRDYVNGKRK